ncbi:MAG: glycoside hydrolase family 43 protein, partial [Acidimicrobiales bacterium]
MGRSVTAVRAGTAAVLLAVAAAVGAVLVGSTTGAGPARAATTTDIPALPRLGTIETVDQNDVGDPFVLPVPAGVRPPTDIPFVGTGTGSDAYQSSPWSGATAAAAHAGGWYVLFGTTDWQGNVPTAVSVDLKHWTQAPDALPALPSWAAPTISMTWAPAALRTQTGWVLYFSTQEAHSQLECIGRAESSSPAGPYTDRSSAPMLCQRGLGGSIDPSVVRDRHGTEYLVWKNDGNAQATPDAIWAQQLSPDGLAVQRQPHRLLGAGEAWAHGIVEAPAMFPAGAGGYWLSYAAGNWDSNRYGTGLAYCRAIIGPCAETSATPFLSTTPALISPGGLDTVTAHDARRWVVFTALVPVPSTRHPGRTYYNRVLDIAP